MEQQETTAYNSESNNKNTESSQFNIQFDAKDGKVKIVLVQLYVSN